MKMAHDPDYYEVHRKQYIEAIAKASEERENREQESEKRASEERRVADEVAKILLDRHRSKLSQLIIERPYLKANESDSVDQVNIKQITYDNIVEDIQP
jgi:hypothetical protein